MPAKKMPSAESDLMLVLLGLQMNSFTREQVAECGAILARDRSKGLAGLLEAEGYLDKATRGALEILVRNRIRQAGGDPEKSLAALEVDEDLRHVLEDLFPKGKAGGTILKWSAEVPRSPAATSEGDARVAFERGAETMDMPASERAAASEGLPGLRLGAEGKYEFGGELGRGGLGRVVEATDRDLGREVAVKMMLPGPAEGSFVDRFLLEARAAGRLSHPNIVPVHEIGVLEVGAGAPRPYFTMAKIVGRDLGRILSDLEAGDEPTRKRFNRPRLLRVFQDVCNAMSYAHDHGVIHRDLKPSNVMVGEYGEVYVVDWGLAKVKGRKDASPGGMARIIGKSPLETPQLTIEGQVLGTPAYMPPEQAEGRIADIDERSDIYSLGAILYEILTFRPPFEGLTAQEVIAKVLQGTATPPSSRVMGISAACGVPGGRVPFKMEAVPPELDEVAMRALSRDKKDRFGSARELHEEIQKHLEGEKERERNRERALAKVAEGRILVERMERARSDAEVLEKRAEAMGRETKPFWPVEKKAESWAAEEAVRDTRRQIVDRFTEAGAAFQAALEFERGNKESRAALADLYWGQFLREEEGGDETEMRRNEKLVRQYNDGQYDARLKGDGTLAISTRFFPCRCLLDGRRVAPEELGGSVGCGVSSAENGAKSAPVLDTEPSTPDASRCGVMGYHPMSGRALDGRKGATGLPELEPKEPIRLKVHGAECRTEPLVGADVWLFRFEVRDKVLVPVSPSWVVAGAQHAAPAPARIPDAVLDRLYGPGSPFRPCRGDPADRPCDGGGLYLGKTPIPHFSIPMGSYLLVIAKEGFHPVRVPVFIARNGGQSMDVTLYRDGEIPAGFVQVPGGKFIYQGDRENPYSGPKEVLDTDDLFVARFPVTCREYLVFLNDLAAADPEQAAKRVPRESEGSGYYWPRGEDGRYAIPTAAWLAEASLEIKARARRLQGTPVDWELDWPVFSVSWEDATAYSAWRSRKTGALSGLPHEVEWEKSARGVDARFHPWGDGFDPTFCSNYQSHEAGMRPSQADSFPVDESPYGVRGLAGNAADACLNNPGEKYPGWRVYRGGLFSGTGLLLRASYRGGTARAVLSGFGFRLCVRPLPGASSRGSRGPASGEPPRARP